MQAEYQPTLAEESAAAELGLTPLEAIGQDAISREGHHLPLVELDFLLFDLILHGFHAAAAAC